MAFATAEPLRPPRAGRVRSVRLELADGARTMVHVARHDARRTELRVAVLRGQARLEPWCAARGYDEALVGGFFVRPDGRPAGRGPHARRRAPLVPFAAPWDDVRACVHVRGGVASIAPRDELPAAPRGDLLQAGPLLVRDGAPVFRRADDAEGFSAGMAQFDSDITDGRYPRAALGLADGKLFAVACDGRSRHDAGLTLEELAALMAALGCATRSTSTAAARRRWSAAAGCATARAAAGSGPSSGGRPVSTALLFVPRYLLAGAAVYTTRTRSTNSCVPGSDPWSAPLSAGFRAPPRAPLPQSSKPAPHPGRGRPSARP